MPYDPEKHDRGSIRLHGYDYAQSGAYFVTICVAGRRCIFGAILDGAMMPNKFGLVVANQWTGLPTHYENVVLDGFALMPNHIHGIIRLIDGLHVPVGAGFKPAQPCPEPKPRHGLPEIIRGFKTFSSRAINQLRRTPGEPVWQRNYYEHVVRGEEDLAAIRQYIVENPLKWSDNPENPAVRRVVVDDSVRGQLRG